MVVSAAQCFLLLSCQRISDEKDCEAKVIGRSGKIWPNRRYREYFDGMKIRTVVAVLETDGEDARLGNILPGINDILMLLLMT